MKPITPHKYGAVESRYHAIHHDDPNNLWRLWTTLIWKLNGRTWQFSNRCSHRWDGGRSEGRRKEGKESGSIGVMRKEKSPEPHLYTPDYRDTTKDWGKPSWGPFLPWPGPTCFSIIIIVRRAKESQGPSSMREEITPLVTRYLSYL